MEKWRCNASSIDDPRGAAARLAGESIISPPERACSLSAPSAQPRAASQPRARSLTAPNLQPLCPESAASPPRKRSRAQPLRPESAAARSLSAPSSSNVRDERSDSDVIVYVCIWTPHRSPRSRPRHLPIQDALCEGVSSWECRDHVLNLKGNEPC